MHRMTFGGLDLAVIDPHERDTRYIYDEIFVSQIYDHPEMRIPKHPVIMDVGANIGLYAFGRIGGTSHETSTATRRARAPSRIFRPTRQASLIPKSPARTCSTALCRAKAGSS